MKEIMGPAFVALHNKTPRSRIVSIDAIPALRCQDEDMDVMNAAPEIASTALAASDVSLWALFWQAHWVVKLVMLGLTGRVDLVLGHHLSTSRCSTRGRAAPWTEFEQTFWSGQSAGRALPRRSTQRGGDRHGGAVRRGDARMEALAPESRAAPSLGLQARIEKVMDVTIQREVERLEIEAPRPGDAWARRPLHRPVRHGVGHHARRSTSIAASKNTSLAAVAPGISEALLRPPPWAWWRPFPPLIAYNKFNAEVVKPQARLKAFADEFSAISVPSDRRAAGGLRN